MTSINSKWTAAAVMAVSGILFANVANAQEKDRAEPGSESSRDLAPVTNNVELTIGTGWEQAFGKIASAAPRLQDIGIAGGGVDVGVGYRLIPALTLGVYGSGAMFARADDVDASTNVYSAAAGVQADWHFLPGGHEFDPWVSLGTGWRGYWSHSDAGTLSLQGMELGKLQVGVDYRIDRAVAISPVVGADLSAFFSESTPASTAFHNLSSPNVNTFLFAGVQGRFDIPTSSPPQVASR